MGIPLCDGDSAAHCHSATRPAGRKTVGANDDGSTSLRAQNSAGGVDDRLR
jgi:hypothetical protein